MVGIYTLRVGLCAGMAYDIRGQMGCCLICGAPICPKKDVLRLDKIGSRSLLYVEEQVIRDANEWGLAPNNDVRLLSKEQQLHTVHVTNSFPIIDGFFNGMMRDLWLDDDTPDYANASAVPPLPAFAVGQPYNRVWYHISTPNGRAAAAGRGRDRAYRAVFWASPVPIPGITRLRDCVRRCLNNINFNVRLRPDPTLVVKGCKECNDIMTQEATMRHLLVRNVIHPNPLVPLNSIVRFDLANGNPANPANNCTINSNRQFDPNVGNRTDIYFSFQATIAYYIHRCLANRRLGGPTPRDIAAREFDVIFAYLLLMIVCLQFERFYGLEGGVNQRRNKPEYRYRGLAEFYTSYIFYLLLNNDVAFGEPINGRGVLMPLHVFHRYFFGDFFQVLIYFQPNLAGYTELLDIIFTTTWYNGGAPGGAPGPANRMADPSLVIGFFARRVAHFYDSCLRPYFSRHLTGLHPSLPPPGPQQLAIFNMQQSTRRMLITRRDLNTLLHLCDRASAGDIDTFMNHVGIRAVVRTWMEMLRTSPNKVLRIMGQWVDAWTLYEYRHIDSELNSDPNQPRLPRKTSECVYLLCYTLDDPVEPVNDADIDALRECPKCSDFKAALRLEMAGAFDSEE